MWGTRLCTSNKMFRGTFSRIRTDMFKGVLAPLTSQHGACSPAGGWTSTEVTGAGWGLDSSTLRLVEMWPATANYMLLASLPLKLPF